MVAFYDVPKEHWSHLWATNPVESPFSIPRIRANAAWRYKRVDRAIAVIWKIMIPAVYRGARYANGGLIEVEAGRVTAWSRLHTIWRILPQTR